MRKKERKKRRRDKEQEKELLGFAVVGGVYSFVVSMSCVVLENFCRCMG